MPGLSGLSDRPVRAKFTTKPERERGYNSGIMPVPDYPGLKIIFRLFINNYPMNAGFYHKIVNIAICENT